MQSTPTSPQPQTLRTPVSYLPATWRCTLPVDADGSRGLAFDLTDNTVVRIKLDQRGLESLRAEIAPGYDNFMRELAQRLAPDTDAWLPLPKSLAVLLRWAVEDLPASAAQHGIDSPEYRGLHASTLARVGLNLLPLLRAALAAHSAFVVGTRDVLIAAPQDVPQVLAGDHEQRLVDDAAAGRSGLDQGHLV